MNEKTIILHHSTDYDGLFCREIARKFLPPDTQFIGWDFADKPICLDRFQGALYILDLPCDKPFGFDFGKKLVYDSVTPESEPRIKKEWTAQMSILNLIASNRLFWIDHHKSSIETHPPEIGGYRIDGVAACRLAWQWFTHPNDPTPRRDPDGKPLLPLKEEFIARKLSEPLAVRLAGEYDIRDHRDPRALMFQFGLRSRELDANDWENMLGNLTENSITVDGLLAAGKPLYDYQKSTDESTMKRSFITSFEGLELLCLNTARCNSLTFASRDIPETGHDALCAFYWNGHVWTFSLYHANHRKDLDLSEIARKHGGGGHRGACGFTTKTMPFQPQVI